MAGLAKDLTGCRYGHLVVIGLATELNNGKKKWRCKCDCGNEIAVRTDYLAKKISCGCHKAENLAGRKFGKWTVLYVCPREYDNIGHVKHLRYYCRCECGEERSVLAKDLTSGRSTGCGKCREIRLIEYEDLTGKCFGRWTVLSHCERNKVGNRTEDVKWHCRCKCGIERDVRHSNLINGLTSSCGCYAKERQSEYEDLIGHSFGKLVVVSKSEDLIESDGHRRLMWHCRCECGHEIIVRGGDLRSNKSKSCGHCGYEFIPGTRKRDFTGDVRGDLAVTTFFFDGGEVKWLCQCKKGHEYEKTSKQWSNSDVHICEECIRQKHKFVDGFEAKKAIVPKYDLYGKRFGELTVEGRMPDYISPSGKHQRRWRCICDCGNERVTYTARLLKGCITSCGHCGVRFLDDISSEDLQGLQFYRWHVLSRADDEFDNRGNRIIMWNCRCDCGTERIISGRALRSKHGKSCGCYARERRIQANFKDLTGKRFGKLIVKSREKDAFTADGVRRYRWLCECDCGNKVVVPGIYLTTGDTNSCGCLRYSKYELFCNQYFQNNDYEYGIDYETQKTFDDLRGIGGRRLSYDFAIYSEGKLSVLIECQGQQHFSPVDIFGGDEQYAIQKEHDAMKRNYARTNNIQLIEMSFENNTYAKVSEYLESYGL